MMLFTVLTTTYNRAYRLGDLYRSLLRQTARNFEWVLIDDGSTDGTKALVDEWLSDPERDFNIIYEYTPNGGKHRGLNRGTLIANGDAIINVDSDDYLLDDAIEFFDSHFPEVADDESFAGISGMKCLRDGSVIGGEPKFGDYVDSDSYTFDFKIHVGDKAEAYKTSVLKKYPFPEYEGENFMSEGAVFFRMAHDGYKVRWYSKPLVCCEYLPDGLSNNVFNLTRNNPKGWGEYFRAIHLFENNLSIKSKRIWWALMHERFDAEQLCEVLEISRELYHQFEEEYSDFLEKLSASLGDAQTIAVYGYGNNGKFLKSFMEDQGIFVAYMIDKRGNIIPGEKIYTMDDELPAVDAVVISLAPKYDPEIEKICEILKLKLPDCKVVIANRLDHERLFL